MEFYKWLREIDIKVTGKVVRKMVQVNYFIYFQGIIFLQMVIFMRDNFKMVIDKEMVNIFGQIKAIIKGNGCVIK